MTSATPPSITPHSDLEEGPVRFAFADYATTFATRSRGAELSALCLDQVDDHPAVLLDFGGLLGVSYSFVDEFFGRLGERQRSDRGLAIVVDAGSEEVARVVARALERREVLTRRAGSPTA